MKNKMIGALMALTSALLMSACGGGGGSPGTVGGAGAGATGGAAGNTGSTGSAGSTGIGTTVAAASMKIVLLNGTTSTTSINASGVTSAKATVLNDNNQPVAGKLVTFSGDPLLIKFSPLSGAVLTDTAGVATIQLSPASLTASGAGVISAAATVVPSTGGTGVQTTASFDYQLAAATLSLSGLDVQTATPLAAYGTRPVSVMATINGTPATSTPVQVTFSADCGTIAPATVTTDSTGKASSTYTADSTTIAGCAGRIVNVTATAANANSLGSTVTVQATQPTNIRFVSASPQLIYLDGSTGNTQSMVAFKVVNSSNAVVANEQVRLSLSNSAPGVSLGVKGSTAAVIRSTDSLGMVSVPVFSGSVPTSLQITAELVASPSITTKSNTLLVASGIPVQSRASLSAEKLSIEGYNVDGVSTNITFSLADRQGNPVPVGTSVNFVTSAGVMVPATCTVGALADGTSSSSCTTTIRSQGTRPANGRVAILAYTPGEEDFVDANFNNVYDAGEAFTDLGNAYRDDDFNSVYDTGEFSILKSGATACTDPTANVNGRPNTCDGVWGAVDVRQQIKIIFAVSTAKITVNQTSLSTGVSFTVADTNDNSMPTGTLIAAAGRAAASAGNCSVSVTPGFVPNQIGPKIATVIPAATCVSGDFVDITITTPGKIATAKTLQLTP